MLDDPDEPADAWRLDAELSGGSALIDLGLYPLNTTRFVLDADATEVYGRTQSPHTAFSEVDEHVSCTVAFDCGGDTEVEAAFTASQQSTTASHLKFVGSDGELTLEPVFYEGKPQGMTLRRSGLQCELSVEPIDQLVEQFDYFAHCLRAGETPAPNARHGLRDMELVTAIYRSVEANEPRTV